MAEEVKIPEVGESITEGFLAEWSQPDGAVVAIEDPLLVLETDKITMTVNAEHAGKLEIMVAEGETVEVGQVVARIDTDVTVTAAAAPERSPAPEPVDDSPAEAVQSTAPRLRPPRLTAVFLRRFSAWCSSTNWIRRRSKAPEKAAGFSKAMSSSSSKTGPRMGRRPPLHRSPQLQNQKRPARNR